MVRRCVDRTGHHPIVKRLAACIRRGPRGPGQGKSRTRTVWSLPFSYQLSLSLLELFSNFLVCVALNLARYNIIDEKMAGDLKRNNCSKVCILSLSTDEKRWQPRARHNLVPTFFSSFFSFLGPSSFASLGFYFAGGSRGDDRYMTMNPDGRQMRSG